MKFQNYNIISLSKLSFYFNAKAKNSYKTYGVLYNWPAALDACPAGWHLPSDEEWNELKLYIGLSQEDLEERGWHGINEGDKLKSASGWMECVKDIQGTDVFGFSAMPGGSTNNSGYFTRIEGQGYWQSSSFYPDSDINYKESLSYDCSGIFASSGWNYTGASVRCIKD